MFELLLARRTFWRSARSDGRKTGSDLSVITATTLMDSSPPVGRNSMRSSVTLAGRCGSSNRLALTKDHCRYVRDRYRKPAPFRISAVAARLRHQRLTPRTGWPGQIAAPSCVLFIRATCSRTPQRLTRYSLRPLPMLRASPRPSICRAAISFSVNKGRDPARRQGPA